MDRKRSQEKKKKQDATLPILDRIREGWTEVTQKVPGAIDGWTVGMPVLETTDRDNVKHCVKFTRQCIRFIGVWIMPLEGTLTCSPVFKSGRFKVSLTLANEFAGMISMVVPDQWLDISSQSKFANDVEALAPRNVPKLDANPFTMRKPATGRLYHLWLTTPTGEIFVERVTFAKTNTAKGLITLLKKRGVACSDDMTVMAFPRAPFAAGTKRARAAAATRAHPVSLSGDEEEEKKADASLGGSEDMAGNTASMETTASRGRKAPQDRPLCTFCDSGRRVAVRGNKCDACYRTKSQPAGLVCTQGHPIERPGSCSRCNMKAKRERDQRLRTGMPLVDYASSSDKSDDDESYHGSDDAPDDEEEEAAALVEEPEAVSSSSDDDGEPPSKRRRTDVPAPVMDIHAPSTPASLSDEDEDDDSSSSSSSSSSEPETVLVAPRSMVADGDKDVTSLYARILRYFEALAPGVKQTGEEVWKGIGRNARKQLVRNELIRLTVDGKLECRGERNHKNQEVTRYMWKAGAQRLGPPLPAPPTPRLVMPPAPAPLNPFLASISATLSERGIPEVATMLAVWGIRSQRMLEDLPTMDMWNKELNSVQRHYLGKLIAELKPPAAPASLL